jgi:hypothetical protein
MIVVDENRDQNAPVPNGPAVTPPPPPGWYESKKFCHTHKRLIAGLLIGVLIGLFMGGTMSMAAVRRASRWSVMARSTTAPSMPAAGGRYKAEPEPFISGPGDAVSLYNNCPPGCCQNGLTADQSQNDSYWRGYKQGYNDSRR